MLPLTSSVAILGFSLAFIIGARSELETNDGLRIDD